MAVENGRRIPDFLDVHGRIRTIHFPPGRRISREEYLSEVPPINPDGNAAFVRLVGNNNQEQDRSKEIVKDVSPDAMSDAIFEIHLQNLS